MTLRNILAFAFILPWRRERFVGGPWIARYDPQGRIYMLISRDP